MPEVPQFNHKPLKSIYNPVYRDGKATVKQRALVLSLCEERKIKPPDVNKLTTGQASQLISNMLN